jgi:heptosyltransferase-3
MHTVIQRERDCVPCGRDGCNGTKISRCLEDISVGEVRAIMEEKLKGRGK